ncbi:hypothetical protein FT663_02393 [Candidozyma haemuli var. vulneris]|uniref:Uncharacterized protein n=1 Tax=Candidozyma haemuli TaxID=45357 RepID=A0A2V1AYK9_9ASCO|nr:hypothetical protein CXQ85_002906 [[Candida] haemuloni]KAF3988359.1 hypothetical protein FT662_03474 [[Candida] haemuloni var. vulneris]KAF3992203.1 hypothetical protein FT663_02393 [[Candida] haemuloni var. vulneris]PVH23177.1 hypothetical protein CXQ85_002906 [[Candida] haemuloni]
MSQQEAGKGSLKDLDKKSREVFKPILDNPFTQGPDYPALPKETARAILDYLLQLLPSYGNYLSLKNKKGVEPHALNNKITLGFNSTVQALEAQASTNRQKVFKKQKVTSKKSSIDGYVKYVFVARNDISTPLLTSMFPLLAFSASKSPQNRVKLIDLPRGSMNKLSEVLHTPNVGIIALSEEWKEGKELFAMIEREVKDVEVPWLQGLFDGQLDLFEKPAIKFLKTKTPLGKRPGKKERRQKTKESLERKAREKLDQDKDTVSGKRKAEDTPTVAKKAKTE